MLSKEENERFTRVGKDTPMGELLRRYWHPIGAVGEFDDKSTKRVRLLGEDLVLYKDKSGTYGLLELHCPHRRADLSYGFAEEHGLRCNYHGWAFNEVGQCISQPFDDMAARNTKFRDRIKIQNYPVTTRGGMLFAYLGPQPAPPCPNWDLFTWENGFAQIIFSPVDCNWLQAAENSIDPVHFEWLHNNWSLVQSGQDGPYAPAHLKIQIDTWDYGFAYRRILENTTEQDAGWAMPRLSAMPNIFIPTGTHIEYRVPIDDTHTLAVMWAWTPIPEERRPYVQTRIPHWNAPITDPETGRWISTHVLNQDTIAWVGQGEISDRENEHLGRSDVGVVMYRNQLRADMDAVERGEDPPSLRRDPSADEFVPWPHDRTSVLTQPDKTTADYLEQLKNLSRINLMPAGDYFVFYAGQPEPVRREFMTAMGIGQDGMPTPAARHETPTDA
jgi:5,5'-dehydrodivanillate O-demethylase oxygenase subunit